MRNERFNSARGEVKIVAALEEQSMGPWPPQAPPTVAKRWKIIGMIFLIIPRQVQAKKTFVTVFVRVTLWDSLGEGDCASSARLKLLLADVWIAEER